MTRYTFPVGQLRCNCSILADPQTLDATVVDPGADVARIVGYLAEHGLTLRQIVVTHAHIDHIAGAVELKRLTGAPVLYSQHDLPLVAIMEVQAGWLGVPTPAVAPPDASLADGDTLHTGSIAASVIETPGHTPGSLCLFLPTEGLLLAGDTLFQGSVGRTDLPGGSQATLLRSIHGRLLTLPGTTVVVPGHGGETTIGEEQRSNPFLKLR